MPYRVVGSVDMYEHQLPFDLVFDLDEASIEAALLENEKENLGYTPEEVVEEYLIGYLSIPISVESFELV